MKNLAIIPARSGSKGLKDKNVKLLAGKPLLAYAIEAAINSGIFTEVMVSTDSEKYAEIAKKYGAKVPFLRSEQTASDSATSADVISEVLSNYANMGMTFDNNVLLQPTSPLRTAEDIKAAYQLFLERKADAVVSVCEVDHSPLWTNTLSSDHSLYNFLSEEVRNTPRQQLSTYYRLNGAIYITKLSDGKNEGVDIYGENSFAYIMKKSHSVDIDDDIDFAFAESLINFNRDKEQ